MEFFLSLMGFFGSVLLFLVMALGFLCTFGAFCGIGLNAFCIAVWARGHRLVKLALFIVCMAPAWFLSFKITQESDWRSHQLYEAAIAASLVSHLYGWWMLYSAYHASDSE